MQNFENEANLLVLLWQLSQFRLCCQAPDSSSRFSSGDLVFAKPNLKSAVLKNFVFDWALCFRLCEVYHFDYLVGLELPIKHALKNPRTPRPLYRGLLLFVETNCFVGNDWKLYMPARV